MTQNKEALDIFLNAVDIDGWVYPEGKHSTEDGFSIMTPEQHKKIYQALTREAVDVEGLYRICETKIMGDRNYKFPVYTSQSMVTQIIRKTINHLHSQDLLATKDMMNEWQPIETAPKYEKMFVCRDKSKPHITFEAMMFKDRESWEIPEEYDVLQNMTVDEPVVDRWEDYEWRVLPPIAKAMEGGDE